MSSNNYQATGIVGGMFIMATMGTGLVFEENYHNMPTISPRKTIAARDYSSPRFARTEEVTHIDIKHEDDQETTSNLIKMAEKMVMEAKPLDDKIARAIDQNLFDWL